MVKKEKNNSLLVSVVILVVLFGVYFLITADTPFFTVTVTDDEGAVLSQDQLNTAKSVELTQSIFDGLEKVNLFSLQSSTPLREGMANYGSFVVVIDNPFSKDALLDEVEVKQNGEVLYVYEPIGLIIKPGESYTYTSEAIDLNGLIGQQNIVTIDAHLMSGFEEEYFSYEYKYLSVSVCDSNDDCPFLNPVCDLANGAKLSKDVNVHYCVRVCNNHNDCNVGQICKVGGYCGY